MAIDRICILPSELNIVRKEITYIRNQMQRDFLTMYNRLEIAVLWFLLFLLIHFCVPADCGHGHMKLPVGQNKVMHWNEFVYLSMILCIIGKQTTSTYMIVYFLYSMLNIIPYCIQTINSKFYI